MRDNNSSFEETLKTLGTNKYNWLNEHVGADVDKMMSGDQVEIDKSVKHFEDKTAKQRKGLIHNEA
ncbi:hypothetical protein D3C74_51440 [compost metagenome]